MSSRVIENLSELLEGHYPEFLFLALLVIAFRLVSRAWNRWDTFMLLALLLHTGVLALFLLLFEQGSFLKRYFISAVPLYLGWAAMGWRHIYWRLHHWRPNAGKVIANTLAGFVVLLLAVDGTLEARSAFGRKNQDENQAMFDCANWLRTEGLKLVPPDQPPLKSSLMNYYNGRLPVVATYNPAITYYAAAESASFPRWIAIGDAKRFEQDLQDRHVNFIIWDKDIARHWKFAATPEKLPKDRFIVCYDKWADGLVPMVIIGYKPNLNLETKP